MVMDYGQERDPRRRYLGLGIAVLVHVVVIYALINGLASKIVKLVAPPIETKIVEEPHHEIPPPPPPPPNLKIPPPDFVPPPEIVVATPPPQNAIQAVTQTPHPPVATAPPAEHVPQRVAPVIDAHRNCPEPEYPDISERLGEKGTVILQFLIGIDGRVKDSKVESSSGYPRLDEAARMALGSCRFRPGTTDGVPEESWAELQYVWKIPL